VGRLYLRRAERLGLLPVQVERDYLLNHLLAAIADSSAPLVFRGGTALARVYWPDYRLSEDLDFVSTAPGADIAASIGSAITRAAERTGTALEPGIPPIREGWTQYEVRWDGGSIHVDVNRGESPKLPVETRTLDLPYSDLAPEVRTLEAVALEEILANNVYMLDDRKEPRDLFDLWYGLCVRGVPLDGVADAFRAKYAGKPGLWRIQQARRLEAGWEERLAHQVLDLPPFRDVYEEVHARVQTWE
jgi:predicted nucleotidyltransferase component of viral defense system